MSADRILLKNGLQKMHVTAFYMFRPECKAFMQHLSCLAWNQPTM